MIYAHVGVLSLGLLTQVAAFDTVSIVAGNGVGTNIDGTGTSATVNNPYGIERYQGGYVFTCSNMVRFLDGTTFEVTTLAGKDSTGAVNADGTNASFNSPKLFSIHPTDGYALIADRNNYLIRKLVLSSPYTVTTAAGSTFGSNDGSGTNAQFASPEDIKISPDGTRAVIVDNHRLRLMSLTSQPYGVSTLAGLGNGYVDATGTNARFYTLYSTTFYSDGSAVLVADGGNEVIRHVTVPGGVVTTFCGNGNSGSIDGHCSSAEFETSIYGMELSSGDSTLYVSAYGESKIRSIDMSSKVVSTIVSGIGVLDVALSNDETVMIFSAQYDNIRAAFSAPSSIPTSIPTSTPTSSAPTSVPSAVPSSAPTSSTPTSDPTSTPTSHPTSSVPTSDPTSNPTSNPTSSMPSAYPTSSHPTSGPTSNPTSNPTSSMPSALPTSSSPTSDPTSVPTAVPTSSDPTSVPTVEPTVGVAEHIFVHAVDLHGDGWGDDVYLAVTHPLENDRRLSEVTIPTYYSLNCACKVIRLFSETGDMTISFYQNSTNGNSAYSWEALFTLGYSDGVSAEPFYVYGSTDATIVIDDWNIASTSNLLDIDAEAPKNKCVPPPHPKPTPEFGVNSTIEEGAHPPPPLVNVRLIMRDSAGAGWCDDSGASHDMTCSKENQLSPDAALPNLLTYPRYFISNNKGRNLLQKGTMQKQDVEEVREVKLPREGSYVFSVSGIYGSAAPAERRVLPVSNTISWDFCGEQGGINERLHFDMVHGVCKPHYIEVLGGDISCEGEWSTDSALSTPIEPLSPSSSLAQMRFGVHIGVLVAAVIGVVALVMMTARYYRNSSSKKKVNFSALDTTEHAL